MRHPLFDLEQKKHQMKQQPLKTLLLITGIAFLAGCKHLKPASAEKSGAEFVALSDEFISGYLGWRPQAGTELGWHEYDGKITDFSRESMSAELRRLKAFAQRLASFDPRRLSLAARFDFQLLSNAVQKEIFTFEESKDYTDNPMTYAQVIDANAYIKRNYAPVEERVRAIIAMEKEAPKLFAAARENLRGSLPKPQVELAMDIATGNASFLARELPAALGEVKDKNLMEEFGRANETAISELRQFARWLKEEKLPQAHTHYALGRDKYRKMLSLEMIGLSPEKLLEIGLGELKREQKIFAETAVRIDSRQKPVAVFKAIQKDHPTEASLLPDTRKNLEAIRQFVVDHRILTIPSPVRARVEETPAFARATSFASMDTPGPFERKATEAYYYVTPVEKDWPADQKVEWLTAFNYYTTDIVSIHEAYPGHYTQFLCMNGSQATRVEKIFGSYAFTEGWAHYTEQMMLDEGFPGETGGGNPARTAKYRLAQSDEALLRICRLCVSIKTHCEGMSVDEATRFFEENCYYEGKPARQEALRGTYDPGYLYYTVGKLEILKLREDWRRQEGASFSLQKFHDELLRHGRPPLRMLREILLKNQALWDEILYLSTPSILNTQ